MTVRHDSDSDEDKCLVDRQLSELMSGFDQMIVIRNLLLLSRCKANKWSNNDISRSLSKCLTTNGGLICLINAVLDCDQSSQRQTTLNQRYQAIGTIVSAMPLLCCSLAQYYEIIGVQVLDLLRSSDTNYHKIGSMIVMGLENRNPKLTQELIIDKILNVFLMPDRSSRLTLNTAIEIIHNLIICRFDAKKFIQIVSHLFYIRVLIDETLSHYKSSLNGIIVEILNAIKESVYLLDNILYNNYKLINNFEVHASNGVIGVQYKQLMSNEDKHEFSLKQIDSIVQLVIHLSEKLNESFKIDLFLILIERMTFSRPSLLTCSLVDSIHENVCLIINKYSEKSIKFVINTFERLAEQPNDTPIGWNSDEESELQPDFDFNDMKQNSLTICLQIVKILLKEKNKLNDKDMNQLKQIIPTLEVLIGNESFDKSIRKTAIELKSEIELIENNIKFNANNTKTDNEFESAMTELNDPLMPVRAHALIRLKQLIYAKDSHLLDNKTQLINALKMCLNDSESYIYLSSVNTLSSLAVLCTEDVLPILTQEFIESERTVEERLKVGEVLVRLSKSIGDFGHHFSKQYINCFLIGVKSSEASIRISSLSNLGQFCSSLRFALKPYIVELMSCVEAILKTDDSIEVKRSSVMFLHLMLRGIEVDVIDAIDQQLKDIYKLLRLIYSTTFDDILQLHSQLAIEEIDRIAKQLLKPNKSLIKVINF